MKKIKINQDLTLKPGDYIVYNGGLKIENVGTDLITFEAMQSYRTSPYITEMVREDHLR